MVEFKVKEAHKAGYQDNFAYLRLDRDFFLEEFYSSGSNSAGVVVSANAGSTDYGQPAGYAFPNNALSEVYSYSLCNHLKRLEGSAPNEKAFSNAHDDVAHCLCRAVCRKRQ